EENIMCKNVISFVNMKGGVGKTTICVNIAGQLAKMNKKILIIDMDPQMNASQYLLNSKEIENLINSRRTIYNLYRSSLEEDMYNMIGSSSNDDIDNDKSLIVNIRDHLSIVCGDLNMSKVKDSNGTISDILNLFIENNSLKGEYDFIFIDCPPTQSIYTTSAFKASDFYLLVIKPDYLSTIGLSLFNNIIRNYNKRRCKDKKLNSLGIVINLIQKSNIYHDEKIAYIKEKFNFNKVFETGINNISNIAKSSESQELMYETVGCKRTIKNLTKEFLDEYDRRSIK
ncbi:TPA: ParA family protein, partial [Clostridioides difficile]